MREVPVILFGLGGVGRAFVQQVLDLRDFHGREHGLRLDFTALCDSNGAIVAGGGARGESTGALADALLRDLLSHKARGGRLAEHGAGAAQRDLAAIVDLAGRAGAVVVDCTASEQTVSALRFALERGYRIVLANKVPLTVGLEAYNALTRSGDPPAVDAIDDAPRVLHRARWETTVGAGLPVIATLNRLIASGDEVSHIAGTFSGTLGYVMTGLQEGQAFSAIVRDAFEQGYTEPDPRDDLGGIDVARKALILARGLGWPLNLRDVAVEGLYPSEMNDLSVDEFMQALPKLDERFAEQVEQAAAAGKVLRYAATVADGACSVGPQAVDADSPLGRLTGTDNLVEFTTRWYSPNPLVIQGRGAGVEATAAGVLSDVVELAFVGG